MNALCSLTLNNLEGALERVLGVIRFRGFRVVGMHASSMRGDSALQIQLELAGTRSVTHLTKHLAKLYEVLSVQSQGAEQGVGGSI
ncbi:MAG: ACT domain-containing protein [Acidobacteria bacterium]|nr:ACT domain-containing protein [Acidobacteriota bacterium]MCB9399323.1 ACT domain-containing protein [Acidobacteriota bacterium]